MSEVLCFSAEWKMVELTLEEFEEMKWLDSPILKIQYLEEKLKEQINNIL